MKTTLIFLTLLSQTAFSQFYTIIENKPTENITIGNRYKVFSEPLGQEVTIDISLPTNFEWESYKTYPVIFVFDENIFELTSGIVKHLSGVSRMPKSIVVGFRSRLSTPTTFINGSQYWDSYRGKELNTFAADSESFVDFMDLELYPFLLSNFRAAEYKVAIGTSRSAVLPMHAFTKWPGMFQAYIALAAGDMLGMGPDEDVRFLDLFENSFKENPERKASLFVASADADVAEAADIKSNLDELEQKLEAYTSHNLKLETKIYENERHLDIILKGLTDGFEMIFPKEKWALNYREIVEKKGKAIKNFDVIFDQLSAEYGFEVIPQIDIDMSRNSLAVIERFLMREERYEEAIKISERKLSYNPTSVVYLLNLANAYEKNTEFENVLKTLEKAEELIEVGSSEEWVLSRIELIRKRINDSQPN